MKFLYILSILSLLAFASCKTKEGEPGPAGASQLKKQGSISGTIYYLDYKGDSVKEPFTYEYYDSDLYNKFKYEKNVNGEFSFDIYRRELKDNENYISFKASGYLNAADSITQPLFCTHNFSFNRVLNSNLFDFYSYFETYYTQTSTCTFKNIKLDTLSGRFTSDFETIFDPTIIYSSKYSDVDPAKIVGKIDVILSRKLYIPINVK